MDFAFLTVDKMIFFSISSNTTKYYLLFRLSKVVQKWVGLGRVKKEIGPT